jgi:hypothetical protein
MFHFVGMRFCKSVTNSLRKKNKKLHNPYLLKKEVFLVSKTLLSPIGTRKKSFSSTLNFIILQMVKNIVQSTLLSIWVVLR